MNNSTLALVAAALLAALVAALGTGLFGRGLWTPDEPREADIAWRMSWQADKSVPQLAGEAFCEKPPLTYWLAAASIKAFGNTPGAARLPNFLYALITALAVGALARRAAGNVAGLAAACAISTFLLSYQVSIWLATDAPLLAFVSLALLGAHGGFHAADARARLRGYTLMHIALAAGFMTKSAAAWLVPALTLATLIVWERRWRELLRWELYAGLLIQAAVILTWVGLVYAAPDGPAHVKIFFWNNLIGRFVSLDAPADLQYATGHRNSPGKYLLELPLYLWPWTLLVLAAARRAWREYRLPGTPTHGAAPIAHERDAQAIASTPRAIRFALAAFLPALVVLSLAATARNIYLAPALPGLALLLGWWSSRSAGFDRWDLRALQATAILMLAAAAVMAGALILVHVVTPDIRWEPADAAIAALGIAASLACTLHAWAQLKRGRPWPSQPALLLAYLALLTTPAWRLYTQIDRWQDLASIARQVEHDTAGRPLILLAPDETTRAIIDLYARTTVQRIDGPADAPAAAERLRAALAAAPLSRVLLRLTRAAPDPQWLALAGVSVTSRYELEHGRRYALLASIRP